GAPVLDTPAGDPTGDRRGRPKAAALLPADGVRADQPDAVLRDVLGEVDSHRGGPAKTDWREAAVTFFLLPKRTGNGLEYVKRNANRDWCGVFSLAISRQAARGKETDGRRGVVRDRLHRNQGGRSH